MKIIKLLAVITLLSTLLYSCTKYRVIGEATYSDQMIYMPAAIEGNSVNGIYTINNVAVPGQVFRYTADVANKRISIPLAVYRSGANIKGAVFVTLAVNADTANKLLLSGKFPAGTEVLSAAGKLNIPASVTIADGAAYAGFDFGIDLDFLLANTTKKYAVVVSVSSTDRKTNRYGTTVLLIDPAFLVPAASFATSVSTRTVNFSNTSLNAVTYTWDYGDGSPASSGAALSHTYAAAGTYTIKLTATGALGDYNKSTYSATVVVP